MKHLARGVLVVVLLLASVGTASAECAWVLWSFHWIPRAGLALHDVVLAYPTVRECESALGDQALALKRQPAYTDVQGGFPGSHEVVAKRGEDHWRFFCLPDTVDPRGPKGK